MVTYSPPPSPRYPYVDQDPDHTLYAADVIGLVTAMVDLLGSGGRVPALESAVGSPYSDEKAQDAVAALIAAGTHTGITWAYDDVNNTLSATVTVSGGSSYTDEQARDALGAALLAGPGIDVTVNDAADTITIARDVPEWTAADLSWLTWSEDPARCGNSQILTSGTLYVATVKLDDPATVSKICVQATTAGSGLTSGQNLVGLFDSGGTQRGVTADLSTTWTTAGYYEHALTSAYAAPAGLYRVALLSVGTTPVTLARNTQSVTNNAGLTAATSRFGVAATAQTSMPASITPSSIVINTSNACTAWMVGLK